jgi:RAD51-like protein 2
MTQLATKLLTSENKPANFETSDRAVLMPQLGDAWTTERTVRVTLFRGAGDDLRYAHASTTASSSSNPGADDLPWASFDIDVSTSHTSALR